jgi:hypothetical protein
VSKAKLEINQNLTIQEHQKARDELEMDDEKDTSDIYRICKRQLMRAVVELTKVWLDN